MDAPRFANHFLVLANPVTVTLAFSHRLTAEGPASDAGAVVMSHQDACELRDALLKLLGTPAPAAEPEPARVVN